MRSKKLYRYRSLSELLFKELYYQEIYFASYFELNDPLDLSARIEFTSDDNETIEYLLWFIFKTQVVDDESDTSFSRWIKFHEDDVAKEILRDEIFKNIKQYKGKQTSIWINDIVSIINGSIYNTNMEIRFNSEKFKLELERLTDKFLRSSYSTCFSETNDNFLMWSHYASKHKGVCLEFNTDGGSFPYERRHQRKEDSEKYKLRLSSWDTKSSIYWNPLHRVYYGTEQPFINFYKFAPVFENESDCDLIGLSKSWTHKYGHELKRAFSTKTKSWEYENEWRDIEINFDNPKKPEERVRHYPIEALNAVYFGVRTPIEDRNRIYRILHGKNKSILFFESILNGTDKVEFEEWEYYED